MNKEVEGEEPRASDPHGSPTSFERQQTANQDLKVKAGKQSKLSKTRERGRLLVFGEGIGMDKAALTQSTILVGRVRVRNYTSSRLK